MGFAVGTHAGQYHAGAADRAYPQSQFSRLPRERIVHREPGRPPVTLWVGALRVIVAVELAGMIGPGDIAVSVMESRLMFRGAGRLDVSLDVPLPCAVEGDPVVLARGKGTLCVLLMKKQEAARREPPETSFTQEVCHGKDKGKDDEKGCGKIREGSPPGPPCRGEVVRGSLQEASLPVQPSPGVAPDEIPREG